MVQLNRIGHLRNDLIGTATAGGDSGAKKTWTFNFGLLLVILSIAFFDIWEQSTL